MKTRIIYVGSEDDSCPADALMSDFRKLFEASRYAKNIEFSKSCIVFFKEHADIIEETDDHLFFRWYESPEEELPPLQVKISKKGGKYTLLYLKELGEESTLIKGKQRKGKNREVLGNENIKIVKLGSKQDDNSSEDEKEG